MRYLRTSLWITYQSPPVTAIIGEADLTDTPEAVRQELLESRPGFCIFEIAEESDDLVEATLAMTSRIDAQREQNMATLYYWNLAFMPKVKEGGKILPDPSKPGYPAPLDRDDIVAVFEQLALDPATKPSVTVVSHGQDGSRVQLLNGEVTDVP